MERRVKTETSQQCQHWMGECLGFYSNVTLKTVRHNRLAPLLPAVHSSYQGLMLKLKTLLVMIPLCCNSSLLQTATFNTVQEQRSSRDSCTKWEEEEILPCQEQVAQMLSVEAFKTRLDGSLSNFIKYFI